MKKGKTKAQDSHLAQEEGQLFLCATGKRRKDEGSRRATGRQGDILTTCVHFLSEIKAAASTRRDGKISRVEAIRRF